MKKGLIQKLLSLEINLKVVDGNLKVNAPKGVLNKEILAEIKSNKDFLMQILAPKVSIPKAPVQDQYPLTPTQYFMWFTHEHLGGNKAYNITSTLQLDGKLNIAYLEQAFQKIIARHESLRTIFKKNQEEEVAQYILPQETVQFTLEQVKLATFSKEEIAKEVEKEYQRAFKLDEEILVRAKLISSKDKHILLFVIHHIIGDGWSLQLFAKEVMSLYNSLETGNTIELPALSIQYKDYSTWLLNNLQTKKYQEKLAYWKSTFSKPVPVIELPTYQTRPLTKKYKGCVYKHTFSENFIEKSNVFIKEHQITLFMLLLGSINGVISRYTGLTDITLGTTVAGRVNEELTNQIGLYSNALPVRTQFEGKDTFLGLLKQQKHTLLKAYENKEYPFTELIKHLSIPKDSSRSPLFDIMVLLQNHRALEINDEKEIEGLQTSIYDEIERGVSQQDITFIFEEKEAELCLNVEYNTDLFKESFIVKFISHLENFIFNGLQVPQTPYKDLTIIAPAELDTIQTAFNKPIVPHIEAKTVVALLEKYATQQPTHTALVFENTTISYAKLEAYSNQLANFLRKKYKVEKGNYIGIEVARNEWMIIAIYAVLKAESTYVPVDPTYPQKRKEYIYADSNCKLVLNDELLAEFRKEQDAYPTTIQTNIASEDTAYIIYTSGSTGNPKGVRIAHRSLVDYTLTCKHYFGITNQDKLVQQASISFDTSIEEIFPILSSGGTLVIHENNTDFEGLLATCEQHKITMLSTNPFALQYLNQTYKTYDFNFRILISGGDVLKPNYIDNLYDKVAIYNTYGPTESTVCATYYKVENLNETSIPIGKPIQNRNVYILAPDSENLCPVGIHGEICISGEGIAQGYLNKPQLTAEKFIPNPFKPGTLLYRTGDIGKWLPDGNIVFVGRKDEQVKIRGYRIELGEIEYAITNQENIKEAIVLVNEKNNEKSIVAYIVGTSINLETLREELAKELPKYMLPNFYVMLDEIPMTVNGKTDKKALLALEIQQQSKNKYVAPTKAIEKKIVAIWEELLEVSPIGITDNFFELGGHSLKIIKFINYVKKEFDCKLSVHDVFNMPTIEKLLQSETFKKEANSVIRSIQKAAVSDSGYPLSPSQYRLWVLSQFKDLSTAYNMPYDITLDGTYDFKNLDKAIHAAVDRHEILRTTFKANDKGEIRQWITPKETTEFNIEYLDFSEAEFPTQSAQAYIKKDAYTPFDLANGPLVRVSILQISKEQFILYYNMHHIISDGWSMEVLAKDILHYYEAFQQQQTPTIDHLAIQYKDYAVWQLAQLQNNAFQAHEAYWLEALSGELPLLDLPSTKQRQLVKSYEGQGFETYLSTETTQQLKSFSQQYGGSTFISLLAFWNLLLHKYTSSNDIIIGTSVAGRDDEALENQIGFYVNTLALRNSIYPKDSFVTFYDKIKQNTLKAYEHQAYPFDRLVEKLDIKRDGTRNAVFDVMLTMHNASKHETEITDGIESTGFKMSKFDIDIICKEVGEGIQVSITYNTNIYHASMIQNLMRHYKQLMTAVLKNPKEKIQAITFLSEEEQHKQLITFNDTETSYEEDVTVLDLFQQQVLKTPNAIALEAENTSYSYKELEVVSNQFAQYLSSTHEVELEDIVAIHLDKSEWMLIAILGILKCGAAYVPLDINYPKRRLDFIQKETKYKACITKDEIASFIQDKSGYAIYVEGLNKPKASNLAYIIYTSGSTGTPKGVMLTHASLSNYLQWGRSEYLDKNRLKNTNFGLFTSLSFDLTVTSIYLPIISGGTLVVSKANEDVSEHLKAYFESDIACVKITPAHISILPSIGVTTTKVAVAIVGGDMLTQHHIDILRDLNPDIKIYNEYGPTEATVGCTIYEVGKQKEAVLIGKPIANTQAYVLDSFHQLQAEGVTGELCIGGNGLAKGYLNRSELTSEKFIPHPFYPNKRVYKTGDLAKWLPDGNLVLLGRIDNQVKINGYRIELQEIERQLVSHNEVTQAVVGVREVTIGEKELIAFVVSKNTIETVALRSYLTDKLPVYMLPNYIVPVAEIPLTPNGKTDMRTLLAIDTDTLSSNETYVAPTTDQEKALVAVWEDVLKRDNIGIHDNFYSLGGDSIKSIQIVARLKQKGYQVKVEHILQNPIVESLAKFIKTQTRIISQDMISGAVELTPIQHYFFENTNITVPNHFNQSVVLKTNDALDVSILHSCFETLVNHHDALRMTYVKENNSWTQLNNGISANQYELQVYDITDEDDADAKMEKLGSKLQASIDITNGPLLKIGYFKQKEANYLAIIIHHLVVDGISWRILLEDFSQLYQNYSERKEIKLPLKTDAFQHWALAQKQYTVTESMKKETTYWKTIAAQNIPLLRQDHEAKGLVSLESNISFELTAAQTETLQTKVPAVYNTEINDVLLTALGLAIKEVLHQNKTVIRMEGHGREEIIPNIDVSRTIGWFTSMYPFVLDMSVAQTEREQLIHIKEALRQIPNKGIGYGMLRYLTPDFENNLKASITFNYLGEFGNYTNENAKTNFEFAAKSIGKNVAIENGNDTFLDINGMLVNGSLSMTLKYSKSIHKEDTMQQLSAAYKNYLVAFITDFEKEKETYKTPSDLTFKGLSINDLKQINNANALVDVYKLSPLQKGMYFLWLSNASKTLYFEQTSFKVHHKDIRIADIQASYQDLIDRHAVLRTGFSNDYAGEILQIVRKNVKGNFVSETLPKTVLNGEVSAYIKSIKLQDRTIGFNLEEASQIRLKVIELGNNDFYFIWSYHHILMDAWSANILIDDFIQLLQAKIAHTSPALPMPPAYGSYIEHIESFNAADSLAYWETYLKGYKNKISKPFVVKKGWEEQPFQMHIEMLNVQHELYAELDAFCVQYNITQNVFIQGVWAYLISQYNNINEVVFGMVVSGRPAELNGVEHMVGLFINTVPVRIQYAENDTLLEYLQRIKTDGLQGNEHHYLSLGEIQSAHELGKDLIHHTVTFENLPQQEVAKDTERIKIENPEIFEEPSFDFDIIVVPLHNSIEINFRYNTHKYESAGIKEMVANYTILFKKFLKEPSQILKEFEKEITIVRPKESRLNALKNLKNKNSNRLKKQML